MARRRDRLTDAAAHLARTEDDAPMSEGFNIPASELYRRNQELIAENTKFKNRFRAAEKRLEELRSEFAAKEKEWQSQIEEITKERDTFIEAFDQVFDEEGNLLPDVAESIAAQYAEQIEQLEQIINEQQQVLEMDPDGLRAQLAEYQTREMERTHKDAFKSLYEDSELGLNKAVNVDRLWQILGYQPNGAEPDLAAIKEQVGKLRESDPYLFTSPSQSAGENGPVGPNGATASQPKREPLSRGLDAGRGKPAVPPGRFVVRREQAADPEFMRLNQDRIAEASRNGLFSIEE